MTFRFLKSSVQIEPYGTRDKECYKITHGNSKFNVTILHFEKNHGILEINGKITNFYTCFLNKNLEIWVDGKTYTFELEAEAEATPHFPTKQITSPMPGRILKIHVKTNELVQMNQPLLVMESMKMEMTLSAVQAGKVRAIFSKQGELVETGQILMELE